MDYIIEFYKNLDSINRFLFWGIIIVIILLLIFSIIMVNKNRKLKMIIEKKDNKYSISKENEEIPIKPPIDNTIPVNNHVIEEEKTILKEEPPKEEKFIAEEYIINYNKEKPNIHNEKIKPQDENKNIESILPMDISHKEVNENTIPNRPYQRNVLREMSLNQTSPIGIIKKNENNREDETTNAKELHSALNDMAEKKTSHNKDYLSEVSQKLNDAINDVDRTEYEIKQEEEAIISYDELMKKKDQIRTIDEEEAVISIGELYRKEKSKLYGITDEETDDKFIDELKNFRDDL